MADPIISVQGQATLTVAPDRAEVSVAVYAAGADADEVRRELASASQTLRAAVEGRAGVSDFATRGLHVAPVFATRKASRITGYRGSFGASVEVDDFAALPDLLATLTGLPGAQVDGPWWSLTPDHPAHRAARLAAVEDARRRAADYAAAFGGRVGAVVEVNDTHHGGFAPRAAFAASRAAVAEVALDLEPSDQTVTGEIAVRFVMETTPGDSPNEG